MRQKTRQKVTLCISCPFPVGIHGERCRGCSGQLCGICTKVAKNVGLLLCWDCEREHAADLVERHESETDARRVNVKEPL